MDIVSITPKSSPHLIFFPQLSSHFLDTLFVQVSSRILVTADETQGMFAGTSRKAFSFFRNYLHLPGRRSVMECAGSVAVISLSWEDSRTTLGPWCRDRDWSEHWVETWRETQSLVTWFALQFQASSSQPHSGPLSYMSYELICLCCSNH